MSAVLCLLNVLIVLNIFQFVQAGYLGLLPPGCDTSAALQCEYDFLLCKLFNGPANDKETLCTCASQFFGACLRQAGVSFNKVLLFIN